MFDFQQKNKLKRIFYSPIVVGIFIVLAVYALYSTWSVYSKMVQSRKDMEKSQKALLILATKNSQLDSEIGELQTNEGVEKEIRSKFGVAKSGESVAVIVADNSASTSINTTSLSLWSKIKQFFGI